MGPDFKLNKNIGIVLSVVVIAGVGFVTFISNANKPQIQADQTSSPSNVSGDSSQTSPVSSASNSPVTTSVNPTLNNSEESGESEDGRFSQTTPVPVPVKKPVTSSATPVDTKKQYVYKNGTYSATGTYFSPGGEDQIAVTLTLANDVITDVSVIPYPGDHTSSRYMDRFVSGYKQYVVGQNIANVNLSRVSGSSLTPQGFNDALTQIKAKAKA